MKRRDTMMLLITGFILVCSWVVFSIYHHAVTSKISPTVATQISDIPPTFDTKTIEALKQRQKVEPLYDLGNPVVVASPSPTVKVATKEGKLR